MRPLVAIVGTVLLVVISCGPAGPTGGGPEGPGENPVAGGRLVIGSISDIKTLQPVLSSDTASSGVWSWTYIGLTRQNKETGETEPSLAEKFELSSNGLTLTYTLRDNLVWSDGVPFTGEDYKYTAEAVMRSKKTIRKGAFENVAGAKEYADGKTDTISGIQVSDGGKRVTVTFSKVFCPAVETLGSAGTGGLIPRHHFVKYWDNKSTDASKNIDEAPLNMAPPAGMGPFLFKDYQPGNQTALVKNDKYFRGAPLIDELIVKVYGDATAIKAALVTGEIHYNFAEPKDYEELSRIDSLKGYRFKSFSSVYIGWNPNNPQAPWLASKDVRQALWYGLNVDQIVDKVVFGLGRRIYAHTPPAQWAYDEDGLNKYPYDQGKAKQLLEKAGARMGPDGIYRWTDGKPMQMKIETNAGNTVRETVVQVAQEQYGKIGMKIEPLLESFPALTERTRFGKPDWEGFVLGLSLGTEPDPYTTWHSRNATATGLNRVGWNKTDSLIEQQRDGPDCSQPTRKKVIHEMNKTLNEEAPWTFLYSGDQLLFVNKSLRGVDPGTVSTVWNVEKWWFKK